MLLVCPNCKAKYQVAAGAIPPEGRDVQCASCAHTWFEIPLDAAEPAEPPAAEPAPAPVPDAEPAVADAEPDPAPARDRDAPRVKPEVLDILRSEARREADVRNGRGSEGRDPVEHESRTTRRPVADPDGGNGAPRRERERRLHVSAPADPVDARDGLAAAPRPGRTPAPARNDQLPDLDEINASMRSSGRRPGRRKPGADGSRPGYRLGFLTATLVALVLAAAYLLADQIALSVPALAGPVDAYADVVTAARRGIGSVTDRLVVAVVNLISSLS